MSVVWWSTSLSESDMDLISLQLKPVALLELREKWMGWVERSMLFLGRKNGKNSTETTWIIRCSHFRSRLCNEYIEWKESGIKEFCWNFTKFAKIQWEFSWWNSTYGKSAEGAKFLVIWAKRGRREAGMGKESGGIGECGSREGGCLFGIVIIISTHVSLTQLSVKICPTTEWSWVIPAFTVATEKHLPSV